MKLFFVSRWGHDESPEGANGEDTNFVVRAATRDDAAHLVDTFLTCDLRHSTVYPRCNFICELGVDTSGTSEPHIVCGPWYAFHALQMAGDCPRWVRECGDDQEWTAAGPAV